MAEIAAPLDGIVVVALENAVAAPLASRHLADLGATIIKIEKPDTGDFSRQYDNNMAGQSTYFVWANRGKQSLVLDLKDDDDRATFDGLIAAADVFIQNLSPAAAARARVTADELHALHPRLVACEISGYGLGGPRTDDKAYDLAIQAESGAMALTGSADAMSKVGFAVGDISAAMYALSSILAALHRRSTTGEGAAISLSMLECLSEWTAFGVYSAVHTGAVPERVGRRHASIAPYGLYELDDARSVMVAVQANHEWVAFAEQVLLRPEWAHDPRFANNQDRVANIDELETEICAVFASVPARKIVDRLVAARIAHGWARELPEVWAHEQHQARDRFRTVSTPTGDAEMYRPPFNISDAPEAPAHVPGLGEHDPELIERLLHRSD